MARQEFHDRTIRWENDHSRAWYAPVCQRVTLLLPRSDKIASLPDVRAVIGANDLPCMLYNNPVA
jgi:hypothetical protein